MSLAHVAVPVTSDGTVGPRWGKAERVAVATVTPDGELTSWTEHDVRWDLAHDQGSDGEHHARVVGFLREHHVTHVMAGHVGPGMARTLDGLGIPLVRPVDTDARESVHLAFGA